MGAYRILAEHYDEIFPLDEAQKGFFQEIIGRYQDKPPSILDIGCGVGELTLFLASFGGHVVGIDLDPGMIRAAKERKKRTRTGNARFLRADMTRLGSVFPSTRFDLAVSTGNSLTHLPGRDAAVLFFKQMDRLLYPSGTFVFQVLNYGKILAERTEDLPVIETSRVRFQRRYVHGKPGGKLLFKLLVTDKVNGREYTSSVLLTPIQVKGWIDAWQQSGFIPEKTAGNFSGTPFTADSPMLVAVLRHVDPRKKA